MIGASSRAGKRDNCFYCGAYGRVEMDHFPIPKSCGGKLTVPACLTCHDELDRVLLEAWDAGAVFSALHGLWAKADPFERRTLAKLLKIMCKIKE